MTAAGGSARQDPTPSRATRQGQRTPRKTQEPLASQWWSQRFTAVLEGYGLGPRMERGRRYARSGKVTDLVVKAGRLEARVQGSRATPYRVSVRSEAANKAQWRSLELLFATRLGWAAQLLAGEVPANLEAAFAEAGVALFSTSSPSNSTAIRGCCWPGTAAIARRCCRRCNRGLRGLRPAAAKLAASRCGARGLLARAPALGKRVLIAPKLAAMEIAPKLAAMEL